MSKFEISQFFEQPWHFQQPCVLLSRKYAWILRGLICCVLIEKSFKNATPMWFHISEKKLDARAMTVALLCSSTNQS